MYRTFRDNTLNYMRGTWRQTELSLVVGSHLRGLARERCLPGLDCAEGLSREGAWTLAGSGGFLEAGAQGRDRSRHGPGGFDGVLVELESLMKSVEAGGLNGRWSS